MEVVPGPGRLPRAAGLAQLHPQRLDAVPEGAGVRILIPGREPAHGGSLLVTPQPGPLLLPPRRLLAHQSPRRMSALDTAGTP